MSNSTCSFFTGIEVERTVMYGKKTLFVVGIQLASDILKYAKEQDVQHIYLGAHQSFEITNHSQWSQWNAMITALLSEGYWVTLDFNIKYGTETTLQKWHNNNKFIPMVSIPFPYISRYNCNTIVKLDDNMHDHTNAGVWCTPLFDIVKEETITTWNQYLDDVVIE